MSAAGLIGQALLGATHGAASGVGERLREDAKLKRQKALEGTRSQNRKEEAAHTSALNMGEAAHGAELTEQRDNRLNQQQREKLKLTDNLRDNRHEDITDDNGNVIGYRDTETNKPTYLTDPDGGSGSSTYFGAGLSKEDWSRLKYVHGVKNDRLAELRERASDPAVEMDKSATEEMAALNREVQQLEGLVYGGGGQQSELDRLLSGQGSAPAPDGPGGPQPDTQKPDTVGGLLSSAMEQQSQESEATNRADELASEADNVAGMLDAPVLNNTGPRPYGAKSDGPSKQALINARKYRDKMGAMSTEEFESLFSERQQSVILDTLEKIENALSQSQQ